MDAILNDREIRVLGSLVENLDVSSPLAVASIVVTDDGLGSESLSLAC